MKRTYNQHIVIGASLLLLSSVSLASDFSLPFVNASELGNMYAGVAATANDASTTYTNPAGLTKLQTPQVVLAAVGVHGQAQFHGTTTTLATTQSGTTNGAMGGFVPLLYYSQPIKPNLVFGFGVNAPFGLGTNYDKTSELRYTATRSQIVVIDLSPSIGFKINDAISVGAGLDFEQLNLTLRNMVGVPFASPDAESQNFVHGWGYGFHAGVMDQITPKTRVGLTFHSQTSFHANGYSQVFSNSGNWRVYQRANAVLPAMTQLSVMHDFNPRWTGLATISYTNWGAVNQITLKNDVLVGGSVTPATIPFEYHNTFDYSLGLNFKPNEKWILRTGMQYLNTPSNNHDRSVVDPLGCALLVAVGVHYQQNEHLGYDIGYAHQFAQTTHIHTVTPVSSAIGHEWISPNVLGAQITWNV